MILNHTLLAACQHNATDMIPDFGHEWQKAALLELFEQKHENAEE